MLQVPPPECCSGTQAWFEACLHASVAAWWGPADYAAALVVMLMLNHLSLHTLSELFGMQVRLAKLADAALL